MDEYLSALGYLQSYYQSAEAYLKEKYKDEITEKKHINEIIYPYKGTQAKYDDDEIENTSYDYLHPFEVMAWSYERSKNPAFDTKYRQLESANPYIAYSFRNIKEFMSAENMLEYKGYRWVYRIPIYWIPTFSCITKIVPIGSTKKKRNKTTSWKKMFDLYSKTLRDCIFKSNNGLLKYIEEKDLYCLYYVNLIWAIREICFINQIMNESVDNIMVDQYIGAGLPVLRDRFDQQLRYWATICNNYLFSFFWVYYNEKVYQSLTVINNISSQDEIKGKFDYTTQNVLPLEYDEEFFFGIESAIGERVSRRIGILMNRIDKIIKVNLDKSEADKIFKESKRVRKKSDNNSTDSIIDTAYDDMLKRHPLYVRVELKDIKNDFQTRYKELIENQDAAFNAAFDSYTTVGKWEQLRIQENAAIGNIVNTLIQSLLYGGSPDYCLFKKTTGLIPKDFDQMVHDLVVEKFKKFKKIEDTGKRNDTTVPISKEEVQERLEVLTNQSELYREVWKAMIGPEERW